MLALVRSSTHSHTGFVAVHQFSTFGPAAALAQRSAISLGHSVVCRRFAGGFAVSLPVPAPPPTRTVNTYKPPTTSAGIVKRVAVILKQVALPPGGLCVATTKAGQQCSRKAKMGHYCAQHYAKVG